MPYSHHHQISTIMDLIILCKPQSVVDIGPGYGLYGHLCWHYLERATGKWVNLYCEEPNESLHPELTRIYNATRKAEEFRSYSRDLTLMIDVIEHVVKPEGRTMLTKAIDQSKYVIVSTPKKFWPQDDQGEYEKHRCLWSKRDLLSMPGEKIYIKNPYSHLVLYGKGAKEIGWFRFKRKVYELIGRV